MDPLAPIPAGTTIELCQPGEFLPAPPRTPAVGEGDLLQLLRPRGAHCTYIVAASTLTLTGPPYYCTAAEVLPSDSCLLAAAGPGKCTFVAGPTDTNLFNIAIGLGVKYQVLLASNPQITNIEGVRVGQVIYLPGPGCTTGPSGATPTAERE